MPEPVKEPDPIEQELNAPFKAAEPVPGSIGSAISMPTEEQKAAMQAQMVMEQQQAAMAAPVAAEKPKKKTSKNTLVLLCVLAGIIIVALVGVLIYELNKPA